MVAEPPEFTPITPAFGNNVFTGLTHTTNDYTSSDGGVSWVRNSQLSATYVGPSITFGNGYFVAGYVDNIQTSTDGSTWSSAVQVAGNITALGYGNGKFIAFSQGQGMYRSSDNGVNWGLASTDFTGFVSSLVYGGASGSELFLAGGGDGKIYRSTATASPMFTNSTQVVASGSINTIASKYVAPCNPCTIFVTNPVANGNLGSSWDAIDNICASDPNKPASGIYKAMLTGTIGGITRQACTTANCSGGISENSNWILHPSTTYNNLSTNLVFTTTSSAIVNGSEIIPERVITGGLPLAPWNGAYTGLASDWTTGQNCSNWTSSSGGSPDGGYIDPLATLNSVMGPGLTTFSMFDFWYGEMGAPSDCGNTSINTGIYCVQQ